jgi:hypothetical protein
VASLAAVSVGVGAASAAPSHWEDDYLEYSQIIEDFCGVAGLTVEQEGVAEGRLRTTTHGPDGLSYEHARASSTDTYTNLATGEFVTIVGAYVNRAKRVTDNGDGTLTILLEGPSHFTTFNQDGERIAKSAGVVGFELLIDHAGTPTDPSDDEVIEFLGFVKDVGRTHDFCTTVVQAIG